MKSIKILVNAPVRCFGLMLAVALMLAASSTPAAENYNGSSLSFTPVLIPPKAGYRLGGGVDPEFKHTLDRGAARLGASLRAGGCHGDER